jgi:hypothetical protein
MTLDIDGSLAKLKLRYMPLSWAPLLRFAIRFSRVVRRGAE